MARGQRRATTGTVRRYGPAPIGVVLVDPDPLVRRVVRERLAQADGFVVAAEGADLGQAVELVERFQPEAVLIDLRAPGDELIWSIVRIAGVAPSARVVAHATTNDTSVQLEALRWGAAGVIPKDLGVEDIPRALRAVASGQPVIPSRLTMPLVERVRAVSRARRGMRPVDSPLTDREWQILDLLRTGATPSQVADELALTRDTVYRHLKNAMQKLGVHSRADAVAIADRVVRTSLGPA